jgi:N-acetylglucosaminyl-diphospho-decaprenol L-rhamnosyltransferase
MALFISVVNHHHDDIICNTDTLKNLACEHNVIIKSNTFPDPKLEEYSNTGGIHLLTSPTAKGFGANNNEVFDFSVSELKMQPDDYFLVLNPDVIIEVTDVNRLLQLAHDYSTDISAINLYRNKEKTEYDNSIRHYHSLLNSLKSLIGLPRLDIYDKSVIKQPIEIDWAAGSFLLFKAQCYRDLKGFDEKYFMYFEDVDICSRAHSKKMKVMYFPNIKAVHIGMHENRNLFSKHFCWYLRGCIRFHFQF